MNTYKSYVEEAPKEGSYIPYMIFFVLAFCVMGYLIRQFTFVFAILYAVEGLFMGYIAQYGVYNIRLSIWKKYVNTHPVIHGVKRIEVRVYKRAEGALRDSTDFIHIGVADDPVTLEFLRAIASNKMPIGGAVVYFENGISLLTDYREASMRCGATFHDGYYWYRDERLL
jgi:hypothetical protein